MDLYNVYYWTLPYLVC